MPGIDEKDREILEILRKDGRITLTDLGKRVGLSPASVKNRLDKLERLGAVKGYSAVVNPGFLDEFIEAFFELYLSIDDHTVDPILKRIARLKNVQALYRRSGPSQVIIKANFRDNDEVKRFTGKLKEYFGRNLQKVEVSIIMDTFKECWHSYDDGF
ncbi:MAG: Lrp/AsnC family transcriptional regulator, leucine-responsive regulatory protein [Thermococcaceae archaeon]|nr:Lrp/AsnC family transcriptional regulator, leucine-responsive regulatory protein [Thermococcaceae archaeon]MDK2913392.1 Lrp/AsnC family transcriptional regulator, leucine-responsive regulatory protein [Thermococcaceae archaeon]